MESTEFGKYLKTLREANNLTMRKLDSLSGVSHSYISQLERGERGIPSPDILVKLAGPLGESSINLMIKAGHIKEVPNNARAIHYSEIFEKYNSKIESHNITNVVTLIQMQLDRIPLQGIEAENRLGDLREGLDAFMALKRISIQNLRDLIYDKNSEGLLPLFTTVEEAAVLDHSLTVLSNVCALEQERDTLDETVQDLIESSTNSTLPATHYNGHTITDQDRKLISNFLDALFTNRE